jgi:peptidyl-Lys metalloendopeptidase
MRKCKSPAFALVMVLVLVLLSLPMTSGAAPQPDVVVTIAVDQEKFAANENVLVHVTFTNTSKHPAKVLKWYTPIDGVEDSLFVVTTDGAPVAYLGPVYKRPEPKSDDYIHLKAGESITSDVDLGAYYDLSTGGDYAVRYDVSSADLSSEKSIGPAKAVDSLTSNELSLLIQGRPAVALGEMVAPDTVSGSTTFDKCTASQQSSLVTARTQASTYSADALSYLNTNKQGSRYTTWFGVYTPTRYSTVRSHFGAISNAMDTAGVKFDCGCKKKYYAYVYPTRPYVIYLCSVFWTAPLTGTDSRGGTLIHEMSHFTVVAGTDDYVYGQSGAKNLAITNPAQAIDNADNHEYFAENTPALP